VHLVTGCGVPQAEQTEHLAFCPGRAESTT
jgi:hypothetical protein